MAAVLSSRQLSAVERMSALAVARDLRVVGRGVCRVSGPFEGCPVWAVSSASREGRCHLVWSFRGRLLCSCEARRRESVVTCSHAQCVRLALLAERGALAAGSVPAAPPVLGVVAEAERVAFAVQIVAQIAAEVREARGLPASGPVCPSCGAACSARELAELGECVACATAPDPVPPAPSGLAHCPLCCAEAEADELLAHGAMCAKCAADAEASRAALRVARRRAEAPAKIAQTEEARQHRYSREGRAHDARHIPGALPPLDIPRDVRELMPVADNRPANQWMWK